MIEPIAGLAPGVIGMRAVGQFSVRDYREVIEPELDGLGPDRTDLRLLLPLGPDFTGFGEGAWAELTKEIRRTRFRKGAVVTDDDRVRGALRVLGWTLRGDVRAFANRDYDRAARWLAT
jgi:hypothetical protein